MSWDKIYLHLVFSTKHRKPLLTPLELRARVFQHIKGNADKKGIWIDTINGYDDHVHCLILMRRDQTISEIAQLIKGESSYWINRNQLTSEKFAWQDDYWVVSIGRSEIIQTREYIRNQEEHHKHETLEKESHRLFSSPSWG